MDYELERQLTELRYQLADLQLQTGMVTGSLTNLINTQRNSSTAAANNTAAQSTGANGTTKFQQIMSQEDQKNAKFKENMERSFGHSINMLTSLGGALVSSQTGLQKYTQTLESLSNGTSSILQNFGILGNAASLLVGLFGSLASSVLNLNQNTLDIRNNFVKAGGILPVTTTRLGELAKEAGFALDSMKILGDKITTLSGAMTSLGGTAGEGAIKFMQIANVDDNIRRQFGRLGVSQEELLNLQGLYLEMQKVSGNRLQNESKSAGQLQRESLQYAKTLITLSSITGKNAEELQKEINAVMLEVEEQNQIATENAQIARLRREGRHAEADEIQRRADNRKKMIAAYTAIYGRDIAMQAGRVARTGTIDSKTREIAMLPIEDGIVKSTQRIINSENVAADLAREADRMDESMRRQNTTFRDVVQQDPETARNLGIFTDALISVNSRTEPVSEMVTRAIDDMNARTDGAGGQEDPLANNIENVREFERDTKKLFQTLLEFIDPMRNFNKITTLALGAAAAALTAFAALKIGGSILGGIFDRGASSFRPMYIEPSGIPALGGMGGSSSFAGTAADPSGLGLRKADLVDRNGRPLQGAALDARLRKLSDERLPKTTSFALKQAARNSGKILKGAATLAGSLVIIGGGVAGAIGLIGLSLPAFARGMKKFNEVDGENLKGVGLGMAGLGAGILALAAEKIVGFFNVLASAFGADSPLERAAKTLQDFEKIDVDPDKIERNGKAALAFAKAFSEMPATTVSMSGMLAGFFSGPPMPYEEFEKFAQFEVDVAKAENNSKAFIAFSNAMATYSGYGAIDGLGAVTTALADSVVQFYKVDPPEARFKKFADLIIDPEKAKINAIAFKDFSEGMRQYRGPPGILASISSLIGTKINKIFGADGPIEAFIKFSKDSKDLGPNAAKNARAFFNFARALGMLSGWTGTSGASGEGIVSGALSTITGWFGEGSNAPASPGPDSKALDLIGRVESGNNYNRLVGGQINPQLSNMTVREVINFQSGMRARGHESTAVGKYQIIKGTLEGRVAAGAVSPTDRFNSATQDKLAISLMDVRGRQSFKQGRITVDKYADNLSKEWASLPYNTGRSYYAGTGSNKSLIPRSEFINALRAKQGGLFTGPTSGYPMELHGTELIVPVTSNSILMKLATEAELNNDAAPALKTKSKTDTVINSKKTKSASIDPKRMESISNILDRIVDVIDSTDDIDKKILQHSQ